MIPGRPRLCGSGQRGAMAMVKIVLIGGGSYGWGPAVIGNLLNHGYLDGCRVVLHDLDPEALELNFRLAGKLKEVAGSRTSFTRTTDQATALDGADFVVVTVSTGGLKAMQVDLEVPEKYGIFQSVGDTVGPGGANRVLRNAPVFLELARAMEKRCPAAWMLNGSNPLSALTRLVNKETSIRALGLCHGVRGQVRDFTRFFGATPEDCAYVNTGIDHCAWLTELRVHGRDAGAMLRERGVDDWLALPSAEARQDRTFGPLYRNRCGLRLWRQLGALPGIGDRHLVEFFPGFLQGADNVARYGLTRTTITDREQGRRQARQRLDGWLDGSEKLELAGGSDDVAGWIAALDGGPPVEDNLNAPNLGQIPGLPPGAIVETRGILDAAGFHPLASPMPAPLEAVVRPHVLRQELLVEAAVEGSFDKALAALTSDPLVGRPDLARPMLEEMMAKTREWLPQF
jgi:alpha-galactosidase/6-phospho-beta-glucosidase family protein